MKTKHAILFEKKLKSEIKAFYSSMMEIHKQMDNSALLGFVAIFMYYIEKNKEELFMLYLDYLFSETAKHGYDLFPIADIETDGVISLEDSSELPIDTFSVFALKEVLQWMKKDRSLCCLTSITESKRS